MAEHSILVINCGSSSIKYQLLQVTGQVLITGTIERIGSTETLWCQQQSGTGELSVPSGDISDHRSAMEQIIQSLIDKQKISLLQNLQAVGHRVVHGGEYFNKAVRIDEKVKQVIRQLIPLAPLHNPVNLMAIEVIEAYLPGCVQMAVFDTAFHQTLPEYAFRYPLPTVLYQQLHLRRYGFHGISHAYVLRKMAEYLNQPRASLNLISIHLGNGASMAAIQQGQCIDTSMGFTPLEGLMMGSRCGDIDPAIVPFLAQHQGKNSAEILKILNEESGLKGVCGDQDMREVKQRAAAGEAEAVLAREMFCYRIKKYLGAYLAVLGRVDAVVFTGGIGEHDHQVRVESCSGLAPLGLVIEADEPTNSSHEMIALHVADKSKIKIFMLPANEELEMALQIVEDLQQDDSGSAKP